MAAECEALVIFGVTGDLVRKKVFAALYELALIGRLDLPVIGVGRSDWTTDSLRQAAAAAIRAQLGDGVRDDILERVMGSLAYVRGAYDSADTYRAVADDVGSCGLVLCYLAVPPVAFADVIHGLAATDLRCRARLLIEKPFGSDRRSAKRLRALVGTSFADDQLFVVDHYLQKESLQNVMVLRFTNRVAEAIWNGHHIASVSILMAEQFSIDGRADFFDSNGTLRDVVQNHGLQVLAALAMEPPVSSSVDAVNQRRTEVLSAVRDLQPHDVDFGQYEGYLDVAGVAPDSTTETFVRARISIDNDRWAGVAWTITAGKALAETRSEVVLTFKEPSAPLFIAADCEPEPNQLRISLSPTEALALTLQARSAALPLGSARADLVSDASYRPEELLGAYARVIDDARRGDQTQFAGGASVDQSWRILDAVLGSTERSARYAPGSWGPGDQAGDVDRYREPGGAPSGG